MGVDSLRENIHSSSGRPNTSVFSTPSTRSEKRNVRAAADLGATRKELTFTPTKSPEYKRVKNETSSGKQVPVI